MSSLEDYLKKRICPKGKHTFSYEDGILKFGDVEIIVKRVEADAYFYDILLKYFSFDTIRSLAQQVGIPHGKSWAEKASKLTSVEIGGKKVNLAKLFKEDKRLFWEYINFIDSTIGGWGCIFLEEFDEEAKKATIIVKNSYIARGWREILSKWPKSARSGLCFYLQGYFLGEAIYIFNDENLKLEEVECSALGHKHCKFIIRPA